MIDKLKILLIDKEFRKRTILFAIVGGGCTLLYFFVGVLMVQIGATISIAHLIAYAISISASYLGQKIITFKVRGNHRQTGPRFIIATVVIASIQFALVLTLNVFGLQEVFTLLISSFYYPIASFVAHNLYTFRIKQAPVVETETGGV